MKRAKRILSAVCAGLLTVSGFMWSSLPAGADDKEPTVDVSQYNVTVPLYVSMYAYSQTGAVVTPSSDAYCILNYSECDVIISKIQGIEYYGYHLADNTNNLGAGDMFLSINGMNITSRNRDTLGTSISSGAWFIEEGAPGRPSRFPLDISAMIASGNVNRTGTHRVCRVKYTLRILPVWYHVTYYNNNGFVDTTGGGETYVDADSGLVINDAVHGVPPADQYVHKGEPYVAPDMAADGWIFKNWTAMTRTEQTETGRNRRFYPDRAGELGEGDLYDSNNDGEVDSIRLYAEWERDLDKLVYLSADRLESTADFGVASNYDVYDQYNGFDFSLFNYEKYNEDKVSTLASDIYNTAGPKDLTYSISVEPASSVDKITVGGVEVQNGGKVTTMPASNARASQLVHVDLKDTAKAKDSVVNVTVKLYSPMDESKTLDTLVGSFTMRGELNPDMSWEENDETVTLTILTHNYPGKTMTVQWDTAKFQPDNTDELMKDWTSGSETFNVQANTVYRLIFFKTGSGSAGAVDGSKTKIDSNIVSLG